jgi:hypothetical protein
MSVLICDERENKTRKNELTINVTVWQMMQGWA